MPSDHVVESHPVADSFLRLSYGIVGMQVNLLIFEAAPETFNEDVIHAPSFAIHTDSDAVLPELACEHL